MRKRFIALFLTGIFVLALTACGRDGAPISSAPAPETTTTTMTTTTRTTATETNTRGTADCVVQGLGEIYPKSLADYKAALLKFTDENSIHQAFYDAEESGDFFYTSDAFEMMLGDRFFVLPILPQNSTLTGTHISTVGESEFFVVLPSEEDVRLIIRHRKNLPPNNAEGDPLKTFTNNHGITIKHYHHYIELLDLHSGYYVWTVDDYYGWFNYNSEDFAVYEAFVKELDLEKVLLMHNE